MEFGLKTEQPLDTEEVAVVLLALWIPDAPGIPFDCDPEWRVEEYRLRRVLQFQNTSGFYCPFVIRLISGSYQVVS